MFGRGLASLAVIAAILIVGSSAASAQVPENPVVDPASVVPALPGVPSPVTEWLPSVGPQPDHPYVPNDAPWPWNTSVAQGSWKNANGSTTIVECGVEVGSDNPYWYQQDLRYTRWAGGARCNVEMRAITGSARLLQWNGLEPSFQVDSATIGTQQEVPPGHGSGWQAYAADYYTRTSDAQNLQIHVQVTLEIQPWGTGARWNTVPQSCTRDANIRIIHCELWSVPFRYAPYPCGSVVSGYYGVQPVCATVLPCTGGQYGIQPNCFNPGSIPCYSNPAGCVPPPCPSGQIGVQPFCVTPPPSGPCPSGQVGIGGTCVPPCPGGQVGWGPACYTPPPPCPSGSVGAGGVCEDTDSPLTNTSPPVISGTARVGELLTTSDGQWGGSRPLGFTYQWKRCAADGSLGTCEDLVGSNGRGYLLQPDDVELTLRVEVTAHNAQYTAAAISAPTAAVAQRTGPEDPVVDEAETPPVYDPADPAIQGEDPPPPTYTASSPNPLPGELPDWVAALPIYEAERAAGVDLSQVTFFSTNMAAVDAEAAAYKKCPRAVVCLWRDRDFTGGRLDYDFVDPDSWLALPSDFNNAVTSWRNRSGHRYQLADGAAGGGDKRCLPHYSYQPRLGPFSNRASAIRGVTGCQCQGGGTQASTQDEVALEETC